MTDFGQAPRTGRLVVPLLHGDEIDHRKRGVVHRFARTEIGCPERCHARHIYR
jgi:hypothetical protein